MRQSSPTQKACNPKSHAAWEEESSAQSIALVSRSGKPMFVGETHLRPDLRPYRRSDSKLSVMRLGHLKKVSAFQDVPDVFVFKVGQLAGNTREKSSHLTSDNFLQRLRQFHLSRI